MQELGPDISGRSPWRRVVQENRPFVPLIECAGGFGSGLLVACDGQIVTNRHVIEAASAAMVTFIDRTKAKALILHKHEYRDLALLRAAVHRESCFDIARIAESEAGDQVLAIGHPRGLTFTATCGIVSESSRHLPRGRFVQTDVAINPGNSGGPLLDPAGRLVGLNSETDRDAQGLGFAIPGDEVREYIQSVQSLISAGKLPYPSDEEISRVAPTLSPAQVLHAAVAHSGMRVIKAEKQPGNGAILTLRSVGGLAIVTGATDRWFEARWAAPNRLAPQHLKDAGLLLQLLKWQSGMNGRFVVNDDGLLCLSSGRPFEGLDISEARSIILSIAEAADRVAPALAKYGVSTR